MMNKQENISASSAVSLPIRRIDDPREKLEAIALARRSINGKLGETLLLDEEAKIRQKVQALPSGILSLDEAIGIGGYPKGRLIEMFGAESSGKTTVAIQAVAKSQKSGGFVAYIDVENALDPDYAKALGVDISLMELAQPDSGEEAFYVLEELVKTGAFDLIVLDSVASLTPQVEIDGVEKPGEQARMMSCNLRKLVSMVNKTKTVVIFINQTRSNVNQVFGPAETTPGGKALKFYASVRIEVKTAETIKRIDGEKEFDVGKRVILHTVKNKVSAPFKKALTSNIWGLGFTPAIDIVTVANRLSLINRYGDWYSFDGQKIGRGLFEVQEYLDSHPDILDELEFRARERLGFL